MPVLRTPWLVAALLATASAWSQQEPLPVKPPDVPTGVVPLPQGPPNTAPQSSLPAPAQLSTRSLAWSPDLSAVKGFVSKQPVTLQQAVAIALYTNRNFSAAIANLQQAEGRTGEARAELNPSITFNGNVPYYDKATTFDTSALSGGGIGNSSAPPFVVLPQFNPVFTAALTLPIDLFGATRSAASQAQLNEVAARIDINRVRNQVVYDVKSAFFNVLRAQAQVAVATDNVNNALARLDDANKNYQAGTNSRFDIITAQRDVADAQQSLIVAKAQVSVNLAALKNTMGLDIASHLDISSQGAVQQPEGVQPPSAVQTAGKSPEEPQPAAPVDKTNASPKEPGGKIVPLTPPSLQNVSDDFDFGLEYRHLLDEALHNRPEILEAEAQVSAQHKGLQFAIRSQLPTVSLGLQDVYTPDATGFTRVNQRAIVLNFSVPIWDGGLASARLKEQRGAIASAEVNRRSAHDQVQLDVQQAYIALVQARQRVAVANVEVAQAQESFRVSQVRYRAGVSAQTGISPQLELSNAQIGIAQAESNQVNALYDYNTARAQLDRALGRFAFSGLAPGYKEVPGPKTTGKN